MKLCILVIFSADAHWITSWAARYSGVRSSLHSWAPGWVRACSCVIACFLFRFHLGANMMSTLTLSSKGYRNLPSSGEHRQLYGAGFPWGIFLRKFCIHECHLGNHALRNGQAWEERRSNRESSDSKLRSFSYSVKLLHTGLILSLHGSLKVLGLPPLICFLLALMPLFDRAYNPTGFHVCGVAEYPLGCLNESYPYVCERGDNARVLSMVRFAIIFIGYLTIVVSVSILIEHVISRERRMNTNRGDSANNLSIRATWQGIFYVAAFMFSWGPWCIWQVSWSLASHVSLHRAVAISHVWLVRSPMIVDSHHIWNENIIDCGIPNSVLYHIHNSSPTRGGQCTWLVIRNNILTSWFFSNETRIMIGIVALRSIVFSLFQTEVRTLVTTFHLWLC